jgi:hypothetical protein
VYRSTDGLDWTEVSGANFHWADGSTGPLHVGSATVFYAEGRFVLLGVRMYAALKARKKAKTATRA